MVVISEQNLKNQRTLLEKQAATRSTLFFDVFMKSLIPVYENKELPDFVYIPKDYPDLLRGDFAPKHIIDLRPHKDKLYYRDTFPVWRNPSNREFSLHGYGLVDNDKTKPSMTELFDTSPHKFLGGATGHGKSVSLNSIIMAGAMVHPPWKAQFFLNDPKILEFKPFVLAPELMPHINTVAATSDPQFTISMLEYLIDVMNTRNKIFVKADVKSIDSFNIKKHRLPDGTEYTLSMPMLILVLDECRAMYLNAARKKAYIDNLIAKFVALARNSGGRAILTSQEPVDEMSASIMKNINIRAALGCQPDVSTKTIGNSAASRNQGQKGKLVINTNPGAGNVKDNLYTVSPFIPDFPVDDSKQIAEIFADLHDLADKINFRRLEPLSFFDEEEPLTKDEFLAMVNANASLSRFFLGEPAFIYKSEFKLYSTPMVIHSEFDTNEAMNFLGISTLANMRFNMIAMMLANLTKVKNAKVLLRTPLKAITDKVSALGYPVTAAVETTDITEQLFLDMTAIYWRYTAVVADDRVFAGKVPEDSALHNTALAEIAPPNDLMKNRVKHILDILSEARAKMLLKLPDLSESTLPMYIDCIKVVCRQYFALGAESRKVEASDFAPVFFCYFDFDKIKGVEIKTQSALLDQLFDIIKIGPIYNIYTYIVSNILPNAAASLNPAFANLLFYAVPETNLSPFRIRDEYPETVGQMMWVYVNKKLPARFCFKLKFPDLVGVYSGEDGEN